MKRHFLLLLWSISFCPSDRGPTCSYCQISYISFVLESWNFTAEKLQRIFFIFLIFSKASLEPVYQIGEQHAVSADEKTMCRL